MNDQVEASNMRIADCRLSLVAGDFSMPIELGLIARAAHVERGEKECFGVALFDIAEALGPAARVIECGPFAGLMMGQILNALERPKAGVIMASPFGSRQFARPQALTSTAQVTYVHHDASEPSWPLAAVGAGKTLVIMGGGGFGLTPAPQAFGVLEHASNALSNGDLVALTLESPRDGAMVDAAYRDFGAELVAQTLANLGRSEGFESRTFYAPATQQMKFGALAGAGASIAWNGTRRTFEAGSWLDMGAMTLHGATRTSDLHPDFDVHSQWQSSDTSVTLVLLRKI